MPCIERRRLTAAAVVEVAVHRLGVGQEAQQREASAATSEHGGDQLPRSHGQCAACGDRLRGTIVGGDRTSEAMSAPASFPSAHPPPHATTRTCGGRDGAGDHVPGRQR